jgi:hypothetical protein
MLQVGIQFNSVIVPRDLGPQAFTNCLRYDTRTTVLPSRNLEPKLLLKARYWKTSYQVTSPKKEKESLFLFGSYVTV